jgi:hypothetical protein
MSVTTGTFIERTARGRTNFFIPRLMMPRLLVGFLAMALVALGSAKAATGAPYELIRWDARDISLDQASVKAAAWDSSISTDTLSGLLTLAPGAKRLAEKMDDVFGVNFADVNAIYAGQVEDSLLNGDYVSFVFRSERGHRLSLDRVMMTVGFSNPELKLALLCNRVGYAHKQRLAITGEAAPEIVKPEALWRGGTSYTFDLSKVKQLQSVPAGELIEFRVVAFAVDNRYAYWGFSSKTGPAFAVYGVDATESAR